MCALTASSSKSLEDERQALLPPHISDSNSTNYGISGNQIFEKCHKEKDDPRIRITAKVGWAEQRRRRKALQKFYSDQDNLLKLYEEDDAILFDYDAEKHTKEADAKSSRDRRLDKYLATVIFMVNVLMLAGTLIASILSGSYSVISAFIDAAMDIMSSVVVYATIWAINNTNMFNYPRGRQRLEIVAVIICSVIMGVANIMMIITSIQAIITKSVDPDANLITICILVSGIVFKLGFMLVCYKHDTSNSRILALDQRNDIITSVVALIGAFVGDHFWLYADPVGAIIVCSFIAVSWFSNAFDNIPLIVGRAGEREHFSRIMRIALEHDDRIKFLDHLMIYHIGEKALVELHIVLDEHLSLKVTHDLTEALEQKIKALDFVERVFAHVDYRCDGHLDGV
ncbi:cation efflux family domain-containing protein [Ditylenchus destructor]|nr:cation efflux family domain-containing protein [Ditylenchus destructor]